MTKKIVVVDDSYIMRILISNIVTADPDFEVVGNASNGIKGLEAIKELKPDLVLLDIEMPVMNGKETLNRVHIKYPKIKVIMMSSHFNDDYIVEFIKSGARAFLPKNCDIEIILNAINSVYELGYYYDNKVSNAMAAMLKNPPVKEEETILVNEFTAREIEILKLIYAKKSNYEIADALNVSVRTIEGHRYRISKKTKTNNPVELIDYINQNNIIKSN